MGAVVALTKALKRMNVRKGRFVHEVKTLLRGRHSDPKTQDVYLVCDSPNPYDNDSQLHKRVGPERSPPNANGVKHPDKNTGGRGKQPTPTPGET